jgi:ergothioneine biosynthesis protein EgtB
VFGINQKIFDYLFNSYYITHGTPYERKARGLLSRPTIEEILEYRYYVDKHMILFLKQVSQENEDKLQEILQIIEVGIHHEQQHQELLLMDLKYNFSINPLKPIYKPSERKLGLTTPPVEWFMFDEGLYSIGHDETTFCYDNEEPSHKVWLNNYTLASRPVTNGEYIDFIEDGGYQNPELWLSDGWAKVLENDWDSPLYWEKVKGEWHHFTLSGLVTINQHDPVCHVSYHEADAYARWAGKRLPTEAEWENAFRKSELVGNFAESLDYQPSSEYKKDEQGFMKVFGDIWEWTKSPYSTYPGNQPYEGTLGEYNAKFTSNQMVLRGGSCVTPQSHIRATYRNFFYPEKRWQYGGIRLAGDK